MSSEADELDACMRALVIEETPDAARLAAGWARLSTPLPPGDGGGGGISSAPRAWPRGPTIAGTTAIAAAVVAWIALRDPAMTRADADAPTNPAPLGDARDDVTPTQAPVTSVVADARVEPPPTVLPRVLAPAVEEAPAPTAAPTRRRARADPPAAAGIEAELALLDAARSARGRGRLGDAERSLREHAKRFPDGQLAPEREVELAEVLCARGRADAARTLVDRFLRERAGSHLRERMRTACPATGLVSP